MSPHRPWLLSAWGILFSVLSAGAAAFGLVDGHQYATTQFGLHEYDSDGVLLDSRYFFPTEVRGIAIGPGRTFYLFAGAESNGIPRVEVLDADGEIIRTHRFGGALGFSITTGKIAFGRNARHFFVTSATGVHRFDVDETFGTLLIPTYADDVVELPNGELLVASGYNLQRYSRDGVLLHTFDTVSDPGGLSGGPTLRLIDIRGIGYSPRANRTYLTMDGSTGNFNRVLALDGVSNVLVKLQTYSNPMDLDIRADGSILVGSRHFAPGMFSADLLPLGQSTGSDAMFVAAFPDALFEDGLE